MSVWTAANEVFLHRITEEYQGYGLRSLEKTDSVNEEAVEMNQTEAFQQEIEIFSDF